MPKSWDRTPSGKPFKVTLPYDAPRKHVTVWPTERAAPRLPDDQMDRDFLLMLGMNASAREELTQLENDRSSTGIYRRRSRRGK
jgi:hypothetical protein